MQFSGSQILNLQHNNTMNFHKTTVLIALSAMAADAFTLSISSVALRSVSGNIHSAESSAIHAVGVFYDSSTGNTETCAGYIGEAVGVAPEYIADATEDDVLSKDGIIVGAPTWHTGSDTERSGTTWDRWLYDTLPNMDLKDKTDAIFGCGDQQSYSDYYCDAAGELYDCFVKAGCKVYGMTSTDGYEHQASKAEVESGKFCGVMFDEDNQYDLSEERAKKWVEQLKKEGFF